MKCTIQNIADHLGLSRNTVSKALKNSPEVSENTRNLVIKTASELGYKNATFVTPVIPASETGSNGTILFLTKTYASDSEFWTTVLRGIESILSNANYHLAISIMSDSDLKQLNFPQTISDSSIKGIILVEICNKVVCDALSQFNLPIVSVDMPNVPFEELNGIDVVTMESKKNLKKIINQLIEKGAESFGFVGDFRNVIMPYPNVLLNIRFHLIRRIVCFIKRRRIFGIFRPQSIIYKLWCHCLMYSFAEMTGLLSS